MPSRVQHVAGHDPVLAAPERAPVVPLSDEEKRLLAELDAEPEVRIAHTEVVLRLYKTR
jgi:hypothetical protein